MTRRRFAFLSTLALFVSLALAPLHGATFIAADSLDLQSLIPPPPADDSPAGRADLETVLQVQADRTHATLARIERVARQNVFTFAAPVLGSWFTAANLPRTDAHFKIITAESYAVTLAEQVRVALSGRVLGGSHFPSDTLAGQRVGEALVREMLNAPAMEAALAEMSAEMAAFLPSASTTTLLSL